MQMEHTIIVGGGPCGLSAAIELQRKNIIPLIIEKENIVNTIYNFPTHQTFFSTSDRLEIGDRMFITEKQKPVRMEALTYYRTVAEREKIRINPYEKVIEIEKQDDTFFVKSQKTTGETQEIQEYQAENVIIASGYYDHPNWLNVPGEEKQKVVHYFKEGHPYFNKDVVVIGGKNSAVDATMELHKAGARITVLYRGSSYSKSIKPWILPDFDSLIRKNIVTMEFNAQVNEIKDDAVVYTVNGETKQIKNDYVFAMTGYRPDHQFLKNTGIYINEEDGRPYFNEQTMETNIPGIYVAGVITSGYNNNIIFIENGRDHGKLIAEAIQNKK
ncbi:YpdA family putative bacillithiol disulfide reductase [Lentibacillus sp. L22]|uniref:YpdA family putative bacillithiol disulfide reductase n=1 Tax=Lentibacillus TaxID=175304 RepID=UPI0022B1D2B0|nr:YpdA family putative bacillithiol disulfide reductase [Lentibacillus daqui]